MKKILVDFKDDTNKLIIVAMLILTIFAGFIPSTVVFFMKKYLSDSSYEATKAILNLEILFLLISLIGLIPILGWLVGWILIPIMTIINAIIAILTLCSIAKNKEINIPVPYEFI